MKPYKRISYENRDKDFARYKKDYAGKYVAIERHTISYDIIYHPENWEHACGVIATCNTSEEKAEMVARALNLLKII